MSASVAAWEAVAGCAASLAEQRTEKQPRAGITARAMPTGTQLAVPATWNSDASVSDWVTG